MLDGVMPCIFIYEADMDRILLPYRMRLLLTLVYRNLGSLSFYLNLAQQRP